MIDSFFSHMEKSDTARRVLIIEPTQAHQEVIPSLVHYFTTLGFGVDVLCIPQQSKNRMIEPFLQTVPGLDVNFFYCLTATDSDRLVARINRFYPVVYCNTVFDSFVNRQLFDFFSRLRTEKTLATAHNYSHYAAKKHLYPGIRDGNVFVLNPAVAEETGAPHLSPSMFFSDAAMRPEPFRPHADFVCIGQIESLRRDYNQLIDACILLREKGLLDAVTISVAGSAPDTDYYNAFKENILRYSLDRAVKQYASLSFAELFQLAARTPFQVFLLNKQSQQNLRYLKDKMTGGINIALGFGIVPVLEDIFAEQWDIAGFSLMYDGVAGLAALMAKIAENPARHLAYREKILERNTALLAESLDTLASVLQ